MEDVLELRLKAYTKLSRDDRASLERISSRRIRTLGPRQDLMREGDSPRCICLMVEGWACRYKTLPDGRRQIVAFFIPGDLCDLHVYVLRELDHSIGAITQLKVAEIDKDEFEQLLEERPRITRALWWDELVTVSIQREWTLSLGQRTAYERIAHLLVELFLRLRTVGLTDGNSCFWPLTQVHLAEATGLTSVHVNRTLQDLRKGGLIELQSRMLTIPDLDALMEAALFNPNYLHLGRIGRHLDAND